MPPYLKMTDHIKLPLFTKYQGQQNDYILISLVRTKAVGHIRDVRRLVVAVIRARLGLYIFGRVGLLKNYLELQQTSKLLAMRPQKLQLVKNETYIASHMANDNPKQKMFTINNMTQMIKFVYETYMQKLEAIKDQLPTTVETEMETEYEIIEQQPTDKRAKKERTSKKAEPKVFKPTPIVNEIASQEENMTEESMQQQEERTESSSKATEE